MGLQKPPTGTFSPVETDGRFAEEFSYSPEDVDIIERSEGACGEILHCTDGEFEAYVKPIQNSNDKKRLRERGSTYRGYMFCKAVGIPVPPHSFGDEWFASQAIEGNRLSVNETDSIDELLTLLAKSILGGMTDATSQNIIDSNGNIYFIDLEAYRDVQRGIYSIRKNCTLCLKSQELNIHLVELIEARACSMAQYAPDRLSFVLSEEEIGGRMVTVPFEQNRQYIANNLPVVRPHINPSSYDIWDIDPDDWPS